VDVKGIILAGGNGTRLHPVTLGTSKQLLPVYNKPLVFYPLSVLMLAGVREVLLICSPDALAAFQRTLGSGAEFGLDISYSIQRELRGIADALIIGADHVGEDSVALILGDNIFYGHGLSDLLTEEAARVDGCTLFGYRVADPHRYGVGEADGAGRLLHLEEKPTRPRSDLAITGLYFYEPGVIDVAACVRPSARGELEITDVNRVYMEQRRARLVDLGRGFAWLDAGTPDALLQAGNFVQVLERRQGVSIACLEEVALRMGFIDSDACHKLGERMASSDYGRYVMEVARSEAGGAAR
jgi:glucose-1-phosphate thymidylyltransferase